MFPDLSRTGTDDVCETTLDRLPQQRGHTNRLTCQITVPLKTSRRYRLRFVREIKYGFATAPDGSRGENGFARTNAFPVRFLHYLATGALRIREA